MGIYFGTNTSSAVPPVSSLTLTSLLTDNSVGDTTTSPGGATAASTQSSPLYSATLYAFAINDLSSSQSVTGYSITYNFSQSFDPAQITGKSAVAVVEYSNNSTNGSDGSWTSLGTYSLTITSGGTSNFTTFSSSTLSITARWVRVSYTLVGTAPIPCTVTLSASDFRVVNVPPATIIDLTASGTFGMTGGSRPAQQAGITAMFSFSTTVGALFQKCKTVFLAWVRNCSTSYGNAPSSSTDYTD